MVPSQKHSPGPPMDLANMRELGVTHLIALCHNDACRHQAIFDVPQIVDTAELISKLARL